MNAQTPPRPLNVPTLTEIIDADAPVAQAPVWPPVATQTPAAPPPLLTEPAEVSGHLSEPVQEPLRMPRDVPEFDEVPRNLLRPLPGAAADPAPMTAKVAPPASSGEPTSLSALEAARASLSGTLRSARDGRWAPMSNVELAPAEPAVAASVAAPSGAAEVTDVSEAQLSHRVLGVVQKQIDSMIEFRLREAMTPILQRHADALVRELRDELKQTMQDVVTRAVAQEMSKVRQR
ncbi:MAG: hypothetical protein RI907_3846 [Pseudomonadota bacterium]|jgi:hypothetical protein